MNQMHNLIFYIDYIIKTQIIATEHIIDINYLDAWFIQDVTSSRPTHCVTKYSVVSGYEKSLTQVLSFLVNRIAIAIV